jgi:predicted RNA-binding protein with PUA-like domain
MNPAQPLRFGEVCDTILSRPTHSRVLLKDGRSMALWLFKEEPDHYSFADLEHDGHAVWDGISNNLALQNLRKVRPGDRVLFYHTGKEKAVIGEMRVAAGPRPDLEGTPKQVVVEVEPVRRLPRPVTLAEIKEDPQLEGWELLRISRLSVVPVTKTQWKRVLELSKRTDKTS